VHHQLGHRDVEGVVGKGKALGNTRLDIDLRQACPDRCDERGGRVDGRDRVGAQPSHQLGGQCSGPASHVQRALTPLYLSQLRERGGQRLGVPSHEPGVGIRCHLERHEVNIAQNHDPRSGGADRGDD